MGLKSVYSWSPNDQAFSEKEGVPNDQAFAEKQWVEIGIFLGPKFQQIKLSLKNMVLKSVYSWSPNDQAFSEKEGVPNDQAFAEKQWVEIGIFLGPK